MEFLHRDELGDRYGVTGVELPAVFRKTGERLELWIPAHEINGCNAIDELKTLISCKLDKP
jgi:hypothetical protein